MQWSGSYEELQQYLRRFVNISGDAVPYDFNAVVHLMLAILDNMCENASDAELEDIRESLNIERAAFIIKLAKYIRDDRYTQVGPASAEASTGPEPPSGQGKWRP